MKPTNQLALYEGVLVKNGYLDRKANKKMWRKPFPEAHAGMIDGSDLSSQGHCRDVSVLPAEDFF